MQLSLLAEGNSGCAISSIMRQENKYLIIDFMQRVTLKSLPSQTQIWSSVSAYLT